MNGIVLESVENHSYLGVQLHYKLSWSLQVNSICNKANRLIGFLQRINKLESIQRRAARFVMSDYYLKSSVSAMLHRLEWNAIEYQVKVLSLVLFYKIIHGQVDLALPNYIQTNPRLTRGNDLKFIQPSTNTNVYKHSFFPATVRAWNSLPANITHADSTCF